MSALHQIHDDDLATLERTIPQIVDTLAPHLDNRARMQLRQIQTILSNVRWNYGPPRNGEVVRPEGATGT